MRTYGYDEELEPARLESDVTEREFELGLFETCRNVIIDPVPMLRWVVQKRPIFWAFIILIVIGATTMLINTISVFLLNRGSDTQIA